MEGKPSLTIEGNPLLIRTYFKEIPYYRRKSLTVEGNPLREISKQTVEGNPLLHSKGFPPIVRDLTT